MENGIDNTQLLADKLGANGYIVDLLDSLRSEVTFQKNPDSYNMVIADIQSSPRIDFDMIRSLNKDLKILALSASNISLEEGIFSGFISKPVNVDLLLDMIRKLAMATVTLSNTYCL